VVAGGEKVRGELPEERNTTHPFGNKTTVKRRGVLAHTWSGSLQVKKQTNQLAETAAMNTPVEP